ncbi:hypothetical protein [Pseudoxanthomonas mexicana]
MTLVLMLAVAFPLWFAWIVAWRSGMRRGIRRSFALVCGLLAYGVVLMVDALFLPFDMFATFAAPSLVDAGHDATANVMVLVSREAGTWMGAAFALVVAVALPLKLRLRWPAVHAALRSPG